MTSIASAKSVSRLGLGNQRAWPPASTSRTDHAFNSIFVTLPVDNGRSSHHPCPNHSPASSSTDSLSSRQRCPRRTRFLPRGKRFLPPRGAGNKAKRIRRLSRRAHILQVPKAETGRSGHVESASTRVKMEPLTTSGVGWGRIRLRMRCGKSPCMLLHGRMSALSVWGW